MKWKAETRKVADLKEWKKNPRVLTVKGLENLEKSMKKFGCAEPIVINTDNTICGGHGRKKILEKLKIKDVDCYIPEKKLTDKEFEELNIRLNKNIAGEFDFDILANEFELDDLKEWGFEDADLQLEDFTKDNEKELKAVPYNKLHILISYDMNDHLKINKIINEISEINGVEIEQSAN